MKKPAVYLRTSTYDYDTNAAGDESGLECKDKSLAQQHMADECDINKLVERFVVTGEIPQLNLPPMQGDFTNAPTYQESLNLMVEAKQSFMQLDPKIRAQFENDPAQYVEFASDPENAPQMRKWGLWSDEAMKRFEQAENAAKARLDADRADAEAHRASQKAGQKGDKGVT